MASVFVAIREFVHQDLGLGAKLLESALELCNERNISSSHADFLELETDENGSPRPSGSSLLSIDSFDF